MTKSKSGFVLWVDSHTGGDYVAIQVVIRCDG